MSAPPLRVTDLAWGYSAGAACGSGLSLQLGAGDALAVVGPNGAGKSTLLLSLAGQQPPLGGEVELAGERLSLCSGQERARRVALLPQGALLDPDVSVAELVALGRTPHLGLWGRISETDRALIESSIDACELRPLADRRLGQLSGGERQRALIAMALVQQAPLLLLDEPTAHLDLRRRQQLFDLLRELRRRRGVAVVMVLHELSDAFRESSRVLVLSAGGTEMLAAGDPDLRPRLARAFGVAEQLVVLGF